MKYGGLTKTLVLLLLLCRCLTGLAAEDSKLLWQIGKADNNTAEFALGPDRSNQYLVTFPLALHTARTGGCLGRQ
ncbi:MAG: hypothetical protein ACYS80_26880 [Planctomycetota bacterium]|jgi:hypothetical protein